MHSELRKHRIRGIEETADSMTNLVVNLNEIRQLFGEYSSPVIDVQLSTGNDNFE